MEAQESKDDGLNRAVLLMMTLDKPVLARVLKHLSSKELTRLVQAHDALAKSGTPSSSQLMEAGTKFLSSETNGSSSNFKDALAMAFGAGRRRSDSSPGSMAHDCRPREAREVRGGPARRTSRGGRDNALATAAAFRRRRAGATSRRATRRGGGKSLARRSRAARRPRGDSACGRAERQRQLDDRRSRSQSRGQTRRRRAQSARFRKRHRDHRAPSRRRPRRRRADRRPRCSSSPIS